MEHIAHFVVCRNVFVLLIRLHYRWTVHAGLCSHGVSHSSPSYTFLTKSNQHLLHSWGLKVNYCLENSRHTFNYGGRLMTQLGYSKPESKQLVVRVCLIFFLLRFAKNLTQTEAGLNLYNPLRLWVCLCFFPAVSSSYRWAVATQSTGHTMSWDPSSVFRKFFGKKCRSCAAQKLFVTLYTKEHTKSMKPHCILGSCSAQFLSIMGWERESEKRFRWNYNPEKPRVNHVKWREGTRGVRPLQLVVGPKHFSPSLLVPRIRQRPSEPPGEEQIDKEKYRDIRDKRMSVIFNLRCLHLHGMDRIIFDYVQSF